MNEMQRAPLGHHCWDVVERQARQHAEQRPFHFQNDIAVFDASNKVPASPAQTLSKSRFRLIGT